jgi:hypothetical protein
MERQAEWTMPKDDKTVETLNTQSARVVQDASQGVKHVTDEAKAHALNAVDTYFEFVTRAISSFPSGGTIFGDKLKSFAEQNVAVTHQFVRQLGQAKDFQEVLRLQAEFIQSQMTTFAGQATTLAEAFTKSAASEVRMPFKSSLD